MNNISIKIFFTGSAIFVIGLLSFFITTGHATKTWNISYDDHQSFNDEIFLNEKTNRLYVPIRHISQLLNLRVDADLNNKKIKLQSHNYHPLRTRMVDSWGRLIRSEELPINTNDYPYILHKYSNAIYEMKYVRSNKNDVKSPRQLFQEESVMTKKKLDLIVEVVKTHYQKLLNVNYRKMTNVSQWTEELFKLRSQGVNSEQERQNIKNYISWVQKNKIEIQGEFMPEPSMIYFNGLDYYIRCTFKFKIVSFDENKDIIFDLAYNWNKLEKGKIYKGYADFAIDFSSILSQQNKTYVNNGASFFQNSKIDGNSP
jgi:hypothetical protein